MDGIYNMQKEWNDSEDYNNLSGYESNAGDAIHCNDNSRQEIFHSEDYFSHDDGSEASSIGESTSSTKWFSREWAVRGT